jgi:hypothetical protein
VHVEKRFDEQNILKIEINNGKTKNRAIKIWNDEKNIKNEENLKTFMICKCMQELLSIKFIII